MRRIAWLMGFLFVAAANADDKGTVVEIDGLRSTTPANWKKEKPSSTLRVAQFKLPGDAELALFNSGGGAKANVARWKGQFTPPKGKTIDEVSKIDEIKIAGRDAVYLDVSGTYTGAALTPGAKPEPQADYRMLAIYVSGKETDFQIRLTGPAKTVEAQKKAFDEWVKAFK
jgi:hypothetical protein